MKDKLYIAMKVHGGWVKNASSEYSVSLKPMLELPDGCDGILFVFRTKKAAYDFWGNDVELVEIKKA